MRLLKSPISVVWEVTNYCNFKCPHCRAYMEPVAIDKVIEDGIMDEIIRNNILSVNISGGEPLLNKRILEFISTFSKNKIDVGISSNGWLFKDMARDLIANGLSFLQVSVDGPKEKHDNFRGVGGAFERATEALTIAKGYGIRTQMNVTITSQNIDTLFYNVDLAKELGIDRIFFRRVVPAGKGKLNRYVLPEKKQYLEVIQKLRQLDIPNLNISIDDPVLSVMKPEEMIEMDRISCTAGIKSLGISSKGDVYPCIFLREKLGNIMNNSLNYIWHNSEVLKKLRDRDIGECGKCKYNYVCGGCRAFSGIYEMDELCPLK